MRNKLSDKFRTNFIEVTTYGDAVKKYIETGYFDIEDDIKEKENCKNCGSSHTRIKDNVLICSYCGSRS